MDDLDALLADLQTNLNKSSPHPASPLQHTTTQHQTSTTVITNHQPKTEITRTIVHDHHNFTTKPEPHHDSQLPHIYQNEEHHHAQHATKVETDHNGFHHNQQSDSRASTGSVSPTGQHTYQNLPAAKEQMYRHETREEIRTETRSSGPDPSPQRTADSNNLSELDTLLHDLNASKKSSILKETTVVNGSRPSVDSLLDELNSVGHRETVEKRSSHQEARTVLPPPSTVAAYPQKVSQVSASNATKELDDLMESLSDFKGVSRPPIREPPLRSYNEKQATRYITEKESRSSDFIRGDDAPPRPPAPEETDVLPVPPPRPPAPGGVYFAPADIPLPAVLPAPVIPSPTPVTVSVIYTNPDEPQHRINASSLQTQVDTAYAKPLPKRRSPSPPPPPAPKPKPPPPPTNQLDSMLGSLTSHMTEQGINTSQKGCCCACDKPIVGQVITALGKTWHPEHFTCTHCKEELGTRNFFERDGKPYCEPDYHNLFSPKCSYCSGPILDKCVTAMNKTWHPEHFFCAQCGNTFGEEGFHEKNGKPYCKDDYFNMFAPKCGGCGNPIMENYISALNLQWHPECFVCRDCKLSVASKAFYEIDGKPVCGECLGIEDDEEDEEED